VKLLFDQNLSRFLVERVGDEFKGSLHVIHLGLEQATDCEIWEWAGEHDFTIVSKDSDFRDLAASSVPPPKAIWLRVGNASTEQIEQLLFANSGRILEFEHEERDSLLIIDLPL
jgi:predicted nuclease of predicted toxin-antitoxin system